MTIASPGTVSAALHSPNHANAFRARAFMIAVLMSSASTAAFARDAPPPPSNGAIVSGSANTPQQEQTTSNAPAIPSPQPPAPDASDVARPASGAAVVENGPRAPQDNGSGLG